MFYKKFSLNIIVRILTIILLGYVMIYVWTQTYYWTVALWTGLIVIIITIDLIKYVEKTKREMYNFLISIRQGDFTNTVPSHKSRIVKYELKYAQNEIMKVFQQLRREKVYDHHYLRTVVEHISVAIICFDEKGEVKLINQAANDLFDVPYLKNIQGLERIDKQLLSEMRTLESGDRKLVKSIIKGKFMRLSLSVTAFRLKKEKYKLVSFQDIKSELEQNELDSWQKLIRVMTHEIMNSAIPIANLTAITEEMLMDNHGKLKDLNYLDAESEEDLKLNLSTIRVRTDGLVKFVQAYNSLTKIPEPKFSSSKVNVLFQRVQTLLKSKIINKEIKCHVDIAEDSEEIICDIQLIEQVVLNLAINAMDAVDPQTGLIVFQAYRNKEGHSVLEISDNGKGIDSKILDNIFIPFYTTKKEGSGIGLSLSRQIMRLHRGRIEVSTVLGSGSSFYLIF